MDNSLHLITRTEQILSELVAFKSVPGTDGKQILDWITSYLQKHQLEVHRIPFPASGAECSDGENSTENGPANLFTTIGPQQDGGICLSGHLDVVPAAAENWTYPPFKLSTEYTPQHKDRAADAHRHRLFGRGAADMKGFVALVLAMVPEWVRQNRKEPIHLAFTYDEESGCRGAPYLIREFGSQIPQPGAVIVGEPTGMIPIIGHKGGTSCLTKIRGVPAHSSNPSEGASAIYIANEFINFLRNKAEELHHSSIQDLRFVPPHSTLSVGTIQGGTARNIIPEECQIVWEIRSLPGENAHSFLQELDKYLHSEVLTNYRFRFPAVSASTILTAEYPGLFPDQDSVALTYLRKMGCDGEPKCVTFGTEAGHYQSAGIPAVVWGPGHIAQAHIADEYIDSQQLSEYLNYLSRL